MPACFFQKGASIFTDLHGSDPRKSVCFNPQIKQIAQIYRIFADMVIGFTGKK
jgi:hypothetical protein